LIGKPPLETVYGKMFTEFLMVPWSVPMTQP
jgi:hypothetical protein